MPSVCGVGKSQRRQTPAFESHLSDARFSGIEIEDTCRVHEFAASAIIRAKLPA